MFFGGLSNLLEPIEENTPWGRNVKGFYWEAR